MRVRVLARDAGLIKHAQRVLQELNQNHYVRLLSLVKTSVMSTEGEEVNPYELLGIGFEANDGEIKTAYRQRSLKVHPDRVRSVFHCFTVIKLIHPNSTSIESWKSRCR